MTAAHDRSISLFGATSIGVGAIVGGGILALAGVAFSTTGPSAILAFALNGVIALLTVASFADLARRFPQSGGTYTYAKNVLSIEAAFVVGWVVWFASILAGVLYALGFAAFAIEGLVRVVPDDVATWLQGAGPRIGIAFVTTTLLAAALVRRPSGGGDLATIGKLVVFAVLIVGGAWTLIGTSPSVVTGQLDPFFSAGPTGLVQAMGYTFIALQGFDLIAAAGGEVRDPQRNLPRSMYLSLVIALLVYLPLLFLISTVGTAAGEPIQQAAAGDEAGIVASAAEHFIGPAGFWLVIGAGVLSMLSALQANLFGASRIGLAMARDRTLPRMLGALRPGSGTPAASVVVTAGIVVLGTVAVQDLAVAGAASSLVFLISFSMVHWAAILARRRSGDARSLRPYVGGLLCVGLAVFQALAVPTAGIVIGVLLAAGVIFYITVLASGARLADSSALARDADLARLRGHSPLVLVPIGNPASAAGLVDLASIVRTPGVGRTLLLSVVRTPEGELTEDHPALRGAQDVLGEALLRSLEHATAAETLITVATDIWQEIARVARQHDCETILIGLPDLGTPGTLEHLEALIRDVDADVMVVRAPRRWRLEDVNRVLIPVAPGRGQNRLRARLLASLGRDGEQSLTYLRTVPASTTAESRRRAERSLLAVARDEAVGPYEANLEVTDSPVAPIVRRAADVDLLILGLQPWRREQHPIASRAFAIAQATDVPLVLIAQRRSRATALRSRLGNQRTGPARPRSS